MTTQLSADDVTLTRIALDLLEAARTGDDAFTSEAAELGVKCLQIPDHPLNTAAGTAGLLWVMSQLTLTVAARWQGALPQFPGLLDEFIGNLRRDLAGG